MQKFINILVILLVVFSIYYGVLVDYNRVQTMDTLLTSDEELQGHKRFPEQTLTALLKLEVLHSPALLGTKTMHR